MIYEKEFYRNRVFTVDNTNFQFKTNFAGVPDPNSKYPSSARFCNVIISPSMVQELEDIGINVRSWPREPEEGQQINYFVRAVVNYRNMLGELKPENLQPQIYLHPQDDIYNSVALNEDTVAMLDDIRIVPNSVDCTLAPVLNRNGGITIYVRTMHVTQELANDPHAAKYRRPVVDNSTDDEEMPF